eukprot:TRINITY_DN53363_c0_g1_i1.p1 TRINITY_DN53363_c0_g1~~TRINITY_DN53363_c0_g1_i1.p1  ORF type:complete len:215 (-),score=63.83 TRINITY_DN53363_c0_g1_i1:321-965(-)
MAPSKMRSRAPLRAVVAAAAVAAVLVTKSASTESFVPSHGTSKAVAGRREMLGAAIGAALMPLTAEAAVDPCVKGANNCFSTASTDKNGMKPWVWPSSMQRADAIASLKAVLESYPKAGQAEVDLGGYSFAVDELAEKGYARLEFLSGIGNFARFFNGGKPFVDDLEVSVEDNKVQVRSCSRTGDSDFGVNGKRLNYIAAALRAKGWDAPKIDA